MENSFNHHLAEAKNVDKARQLVRQAWIFTAPAIYEDDLLDSIASYLMDRFEIHLLFADLASASAHVAADS